MMHRGKRLRERQLLHRIAFVAEALATASRSSRFGCPVQWVQHDIGRGVRLPLVDASPPFLPSSGCEKTPGAMASTLA